MIKKLLAISLITLPMFASAQPADEDDNLDDAIRNFGFTSGATLQCASESTKKDIETLSLKAFTGIGRLFGTDRAFFYAAAFGSGAVMPIDLKKCDEYTNTFKRLIQKSEQNK